VFSARIARLARVLAAVNPSRPSKAFPRWFPIKARQAATRRAAAVPECDGIVFSGFLQNLKKNAATAGAVAAVAAESWGFRAAGLCATYPESVPESSAQHWAGWGRAVAAGRRSGPVVRAGRAWPDRRRCRRPYRRHLYLSSLSAAAACAFPGCPALSQQLPTEWLRTAGDGEAPARIVLVHICRHRRRGLSRPDGLAVRITLETARGSELEPSIT
jgi:hypothetical protein